MSQPVLLSTDSLVEERNVELARENERLRRAPGAEIARNEALAAQRHTAAAAAPQGPDLVAMGSPRSEISSTPPEGPNPAITDSAAVSRVCEDLCCNAVYARGLLEIVHGDVAAAVEIFAAGLMPPSGPVPSSAAPSTEPAAEVLADRFLDAAVAQVCEIVGCDAEAAAQLLDIADGDVAAAIEFSTGTYDTF